ncbi:MAG: betaine/proline/choline family ABC transporter ATP-binding protein [Clostridiaceae bacterium]|nr:betaine/proline/choline family ABC transporter ATP-binding protein [Clostridiaceae bacterium]
MVRLKNIQKEYNGSVAVDDLNLEIEKGQFVVLIGPSGCGKTTTLKMINRLIEPTSGSVFINGEDVTKVNPVALRRKIGYVIQQIGLFPNMTIMQNIEVVPKLLKWPADKRRERAQELLRLVEMDPEVYGDRYPSELSGGQQQRIGVLRALAAEPPLILMDEPFGALDPITKELLQDELKKLQTSLGKTIVFVTHDMDEALKLADYIVLMKDGRVVQADAPEELLSNPKNEFVAEFIGKHRMNSNFCIDEVKDVMKTKPVTATREKGIGESIALMKSRNVDSIIVVDKAGRFEGIVTIGRIMTDGKNHKNISRLVEEDVPVVKMDSNAKEAFDLLIQNKLDFIPAIDDDNVVKGLITKSSIAKAMAEVVWKGADND